MELIRGWHNLRPEHRGCVVTIGNFDGVHLGHQAVIGQLAEQAEALRLPALVTLFEPQPREYFQSERAPARLTRFREKIRALRRLAVDRVLAIRFDTRFAALPPEVFIERLLVQDLGARYVVVGDDFRFGAKRGGDFEMLKRAGVRHGFQVTHMHSFTVDGERVSSTRVRTALARADLETAAKLLGRRYRMSGRVAHGNKLGRTLGIPTANIHLHRHSSPLQGIYVVEVYGLDGEPIRGVASIGTRPTVGGTKALLEVHLLDFDRDIYGAHVSVEFLQKLRDEKRFDTVEAMRVEIVNDIARARAIFDRRSEMPERRARQL